MKQQISKFLEFWRAGSWETRKAIRARFKQSERTYERVKDYYIEVA